MSPTLKALASNLSRAIDGYDASDPGPDGFAQRKKIIALATDILRDVKEPREHPFEYCVSMAEMGALRVLMDWGALEHIPHTGGISYSDLAKKVDAEEPVLRRFCWTLVSTGILKQIGDDQVAHTKFSPMYAHSDPQGIFFKIMFDEGMVPYSRFPDYFKRYGRREPDEPTNSPHGFGWGVPDKNFWDAVTGQRFLDFNISMQTLDNVLPVRGIFPFKWISDNAYLVDKDAPLVVDVGGGKGQALAQIRRECPDIPAERVVLQDRAPVIEDARKADVPELRGAQMVPHDFFQPQPSKGALVYYIRRIMHDWSDKYNVQILGHCRDAMTPHSRILICEQVMHSPPTTLSTQTDICMMGLGAKERTREDWYRLVEAADLELVKIWQIPSSEVSVIECRKKGSSNCNGHARLGQNGV